MYALTAVPCRSKAELHEKFVKLAFVNSENIYNKWYDMLLINNWFKIITWQKSARNIFKSVKRLNVF